MNGLARIAAGIEGHVTEILQALSKESHRQQRRGCGVFGMRLGFVTVVLPELHEEVSEGRVAETAGLRSEEPQERERDLAVMSAFPEPLLERSRRETVPSILLANVVHGQRGRYTVIGKERLELGRRQPVKLRVVHVHGLDASMRAPAPGLERQRSNGHDEVPADTKVVDILVREATATAQNDQGMLEVARAPGQLEP